MRLAGLTVSPSLWFRVAELDANTILYDIYYSASGPETDSRRKVFFAASVKAWSVGVVEVLQQLEETMVGTFALGDQVVSSTGPVLSLPSFVVSP